MNRIRIAAVAGVLSLAACYTVSYQTKQQGGGGYQERGVNYFLWGLVGDETIDLKALCPKGVSRWRSQQSFVNGLVGFITLGIYIPRTITVECAGGAAYQITLDPLGGRVAALSGPRHDG